MEEKDWSELGRQASEAGGKDKERVTVGGEGGVWDEGGYQCMLQQFSFRGITTFYTSF